MTKQAFYQVVTAHQRLLRAREVKPAAYPRHHYLAGKDAALAYALWLLNRMKRMFSSGEEAEALANLTFVEATLWNWGVVRLDELKAHHPHH